MKSVLWTALGAALVALGAAGHAANCEQTSVGLVPISDLGPGLYLGQFPGGLYTGGANVPPPAHAAEGIARAAAIEPLTPDGAPLPGGKYVLLSIGMSNTTQEFCAAHGTFPCNPWTFMGQAAVHPGVDHESLVIANGARGGQAAAAWTDPGSPNYNIVRDDVLTVLGVTEAQVQAVWVKQADPGPTVSLPDPGADAYVLMGHLGDIARAVRVRYPNVRMIFFSSRIYAGYASTALNPEPYAYESAFSVKWLIEAQIDQMNGGPVNPIAGDLDYGTVAPWLGWGPYPWADGLSPRSDGLVWACADLAGDGTHPSESGQEKVGTMLLDFFLTSPFTDDWFTVEGGSGIPGDLDGDGTVGIADFLLLLSAWGPCPDPCPPACPGDLDLDCNVGVNDFLILLANWG